jgi:SAM-dependent methyltransferase
MSIDTRAEPANSAQAEYWNAAAGETWAALSDRLDRMIGPLGLATMDALAPATGERIADIGCGCGQTSVELARRVGERGDILGVDISVPMLRVARARADRAGVANARFLEADAQAHPFAPGSAERVFSRFGVMFFSDPIAAFANIRTVLAPGGRLGFVCWQAMGDNPIMTLPLIAALPYLPADEAPADPLTPGPFAFADRDRLFGILKAAGFHDIAITPHRQALTSGDLEETIDTSLKIGPLGRMLRDAPDRQPKIIEAIRAALTPFVSDAGVFLDSATWIVTARKEPLP